jgi:LEA14-like dessication related protein
MRKLLFFFILSLFYSCSGVQELSVSDIKSLNVKNIDSKTATFQVGVTIKNPNAFRIKVTAGELNVKLSNRYW